MCDICMTVSGSTLGTDRVQPMTKTYNVAPTEQVLTVRSGRDGDRHGSLMRWGLIPAWAKSLPTSNPLINVPAETVAERPSFKTALVRRRCLILADGFYEWDHTVG